MRTCAFITVIACVLTNGCGGDIPGRRVGPLASAADSLVVQVKSWSCGASKKTSTEGMLRYCTAQQNDTLVYFALDSTDRVSLVGRQFTVTSENIDAKYDALAKNAAARYGAGQRCPSQTNTHDRRWDTSGALLLIYSNTPIGGLTYKPFIRVVRHLGNVRCGDIYSPVLGY
jgi:hypothetical protein